MQSIFFFWDNISTCPKEYRDNFAIAQALNPESQILLIDKLKGGEEIKKISTELYGFYNKIKIPAACADIARLACLYNHGGWYLDADIRLVRTLDHFNDHDRVFFSRDDTNYPRITNMAMKTPKNDPYMKDCLDVILAYLKNNIYMNRVWRLTGPGVINSIAWKYNLLPETTESFSKHFNSHLKTFNCISTSTSSSWQYQQATGVLEDASYDFNALPQKSSARMFDYLFEWLYEKGNKTEHIEALLKARGSEFLKDLRFRKYIYEHINRINNANLLTRLAEEHSGNSDLFRLLVSRAVTIKPKHPSVQKIVNKYNFSC